MAIGTTAAILGAGALGAAATISAGAKQAAAGGRAAKRALSVEQQALEEEQRRFEQLLPFREAALASLAKLKGGFDVEESPFFQFRKEEETEALKAQLAATGGLRGGRGLRAIQELSRGLSAEETERQYGREFDIAQFTAGVGFPAARGAPDVGGVSAAQLAKGQAGVPLTSAIQTEAAGIPALIAELLRLRGRGTRPSLFGGTPTSSLGRIEPSIMTA